MSAREPWSDTHDEPPPEVRALLEAGRAAARARRGGAVPAVSPEQRARMERAFFAALDREERRYARARWTGWGKRAVLTAGALAAGVVAAIRFGAGPAANDAAPPSRKMPVMEESAPASPVPGTAASASASAAPSARRPAPRR
jgi:acyl-CoA reductase-like NAD-dependent aldehyde dehydrogenase